MYCQYQTISNKCIALEILWSAPLDNLDLALVNFKPMHFLGFTLSGVGDIRWIIEKDKPSQMFSWYQKY